MSNRDDYSYFKRRAQREREIAETCKDNAVALAHLNMAAAYDRRLATTSPPEEAPSRIEPDRAIPVVGAAFTHVVDSDSSQAKHAASGGRASDESRRQEA